MSGCIAVINAGSSSVKFALYEASGEANVLFRGQVEGIGVAPHLRIAGLPMAGLSPSTTGTRMGSTMSPRRANC